MRVGAGDDGGDAAGFSVQSGRHQPGNQEPAERLAADEREAREPPRCARASVHVSGQSRGVRGPDRRHHRGSVVVEMVAHRRLHPCV